MRAPPPDFSAHKISVVSAMSKKKRRSSQSFFKSIEGSKLDIWRAYVAAGGRVGEVAAQFQISPADVEKIVSEVEDFFHAPLTDPERLVGQISILNEAASRAEYILYEIIEFYYNRWKTGGDEPPPQLIDTIGKWHGLLMKRITVHLDVLKNLQKQLAIAAAEEEEQKYLQQLISEPEEDEEGEVT